MTIRSIFHSPFFIMLSDAGSDCWNVLCAKELWWLFFFFLQNRHLSSFPGTDTNLDKSAFHQCYLLGYLSVCSSVFDSVIAWTVACQGPLSMGFSSQEYWSELPFLSVRGLPDPGIKPVSLSSPVLAGRFFTTTTHGKPHLAVFKAAVNKQRWWTNGHEHKGA